MMEESLDIRIVVLLQPQHSEYSQIRDAIRRIDDSGADAVLTWDHFFPLSGDPDGKHFEAWTMVAAWAEQTSRIEIGTFVTPTSYRNPDLLADMARTVDHISGGRLILGLGSGWAERDYLEYGYDFGDAKTRSEEFTVALERLTTRLAKLNPRPVRPIPVLIGGDGEKRTFPIVARYASVWHTFSSPDTLAHKRSILDGQTRAAGRDPSSLRTAVSVNDLSGGAFGTPEVLGEQFASLGVTDFVLGVGAPDFDLELLRSWIDWRDHKRATSVVAPDGS